jgi:uroporphyrin-3 C-methyltransferase
MLPRARSSVSMRSMSEDLPRAPVLTDEPAPRAAPAPRKGSGLAWLPALLALAAAGYAVWRVEMLARGETDAQAQVRVGLTARVDELTRAGEQRKRDMDSLRARLSDADSVNRSVREELLALGERSRHLEDAVANLAEQRQSGRDALAINEAEFVLQQAQERLVLFHDAQAAIAAYRLADSALAAAEDPLFTSVRQTITAELHALEASKPVQTQAALAALERVRASLASLPPPGAGGSEEAPASRWQRFLGQFVRISHGTDSAPFGERDLGLTRSLAALDLRSAEAALLAREPDAYKAALVRARAGIAAAFDPGADATRAALAELDRLEAAPLAPALPELGSALKELRNLRATRALAQPPAARPAPPQDVPADAGHTP